MEDVSTTSIPKTTSAPTLQYWRYKLPRTAAPESYTLFIAVTLPTTAADEYQNISQAPPYNADSKLS